MKTVQTYLITPNEEQEDRRGTSTAPGRQLPLFPRCRPIKTLLSPADGSEFSSTAATAPIGTPANLLYERHSNLAALSGLINTSYLCFLKETLGSSSEQIFTLTIIFIMHEYYQQIGSSYLNSLYGYFIRDTYLHTITLTM